MVASLPGEIWKDIPGYEGIYEASNFGRVKSANRFYYAGKNHLTKCTAKEKIIKCKPDRTGVPKLRTNKFGERGLLNIRRIIAILFVPNPNNKKCVSQIDGDKLNISADNLEWGSFGDIMKGAYRKMTKPKITGGRNHKSRLVLDNNTGIFYDSIKEAATAKNINIEIIYKQIKGNYGTKTSLIYV